MHKGWGWVPLIILGIAENLGILFLFKYLVGKFSHHSKIEERLEKLEKQYMNIQPEVKDREPFISSGTGMKIISYHTPEQKITSQEPEGVLSKRDSLAKNS